MSGRVVAVAGASGLVGSALVRALAADERVARVVCLVRRALAPPAELPGHDKLEQRTVAAFDEAALAAAMPKDVDDAYCCLGTTIKVAGSQEAFFKVDHDAVVAFARAARSAGARRFVVVSSQGADRHSLSFYLRVKGDMEAAVTRVGFEAAHLIRPGILDGQRAQTRPGEALGIAVARGVSQLFGGPRFKYAPIRAETVARAMVALAFGEERGAVATESARLQQLGGAAG
ncbi:MAG: NAD(P)H-binding protein [Deltaproteobacteria bacterium]|nr:NAD(P)H-binding protein [Deltaproteobacteria bacterium]